MLSKKLQESGYTLIELMVGMTIGLFITASLYNLFISQTRTYTIQDKLAEMHQNVRIGLVNLVETLRSAGFDPNGAHIFGVTKYDEDENDIFPASDSVGLYLGTNTELYFTSDQDGDGEIDKTDEERFGFKIEADNFQVAVISPTDGSISSWVTYAENVENMTVAYTYADGNISTTVGMPDNSEAGRNFSDIRAVAVSLTAKTSAPDQQYTHPTVGDGYRRITLSTEVLLRNMGIYN